MTTIPTIELDGEPRSAVTTEEFARLVGTTPSTVTAWCRAGQIPGARKMGRAWRIPAGAAA